MEHKASEQQLPVLPVVTGKVVKTYIKSETNPVFVPVVKFLVLSGMQ